MKNWPSILICSTLLAVVTFGCQTSARTESKPNFILILTDDLGWTSLSALMDDRLPDSRSDYHETPVLEKMAREGMRFTRGYAPDPICTPSRRSIQFGQTSIRQGEESFVSSYKHKEKRPTSIAEVLKAIQPTYITAHFGKWDLRAGITPEDLGYDESDGDTGNSHGDFSQDREEKWLKKYLIENPKQMDSLTSRSIRFIRQRGEDKRPFYLQLSHYATHVNFETRPGTFEKFEAKDKGLKHDHPAWAGMIHDLDASIGQLLDELEKSGLKDNTYIVFMADNGAVEFIPPVSNRLDHPETFDRPMRNAPLRGGKWTLYEGGIRVPFLVLGPGVKGGVQTDVPVAGWDLLPTFCDLAGGKTDSLRDGGSFARILKNGGEGEVTRMENAFYFHRFNNSYPHSAIIEGDYKLIHFWKAGKSELYNLKADPGERTDLADKEKDVTTRLELALFSYIRRHNPELTQKYL